ncbi:RNase H domain-containing protein [Trichonephila clavipes]|nr:RNase H domain-containing protein [Trichonephila clavipes]
MKSPCDAIKIYTDGSRLDDRAGSGIYIENSGQNFYFCHRNPDFSSVFKSELMAIKLGLEAIINESDYGELWILSDSRSSLQHLHNWTQVETKQASPSFTISNLFQSITMFISVDTIHMLTSLK